MQRTEVFGEGEVSFDTFFVKATKRNDPLLRAGRGYCGNCARGLRGYEHLTNLESWRNSANIEARRKNQIAGHFAV